MHPAPQAAHSAGRGVRRGSPHLLGPVPRSPRRDAPQQAHLTARLEPGWAWRCATSGWLTGAEGAYELLPRLKAADLDLVFCDMLTYATSLTFGVLVRGLDVPVVLVALQPTAAMDYAHGSTYMQLCNDDFCSVPEFTGVAVRMGRPRCWWCWG